jgi:NodT family efflux transporter outer membrane factor (OMF) lipoprotein
MGRILKTVLTGLAAAVIFTSCAPFTPNERVSPEGPLPERYEGLYEAVPDPAVPWWETFQDPELDALVNQALVENHSIKQAWARLRQIQAIAVQTRSSVYPSLNLTSSVSHTRQEKTVQAGTGGPGSPAGGETSDTSEYYSLGVASSYEIDLWGRIRSADEAARLDVSASREDLNTVATTIASQVAQQWINIVSQRMQKQLLKQQLEVNQTYLELVELRFNKAMVSALDVFQQRQIVAQVKAQIPLVEAREQLFLHQLNALLGSPPKASIHLTRRAMPVLNPVPATGLPADLLANRPDVRATGLRLKAADWNVAAAKANRLPSISLSASASYGASELDLVFDNWMINLAGNLMAPLLDGGRRAAEVDRNEAVVDERLSAYRATVLSAIKDVEDALVNEAKQREHIQALDVQLEAARNALTEARERYRKGIIQYLPVLTQLSSVQNLERDMIQKQTDLVIYRIALYLAIGGNWTEALHPTIPLKS